jgi:hypothetical protein
MIRSSIWNIILSILVLIIGIIIIRIASNVLKKWMIKAKMEIILAEFSTRIL